MAAATLDSDAQLIAGLKAFIFSSLAASLPGVVPLASIRSSYPNVDLVGAVGTGTLDPLIVIALGAEAAFPAPVGDSSGKVARPPIATGATSSTALIPQVILRTAVTITVVATGDEGKTLRGKVKNAIAAAFGTVVVIPLPDSVESAQGFTSATATTYGVTAQLVYKSAKPNDVLDEHMIFRHDILLDAFHARYVTRTDSVVQGVAVQTLFPTYR